MFAVTKMKLCDSMLEYNTKTPNFSFTLLLIQYTVQVSLELSKLKISNFALT